MIHLESHEYKELLAAFQAWDELVSLPHIADMKEYRRQGAECLRRRDAAYSNYASVHGNPTGDDLRVLPGEAFRAFYRSAVHILFHPLHNVLDSYGIGTIMIRDDEMWLMPISDDFRSYGADTELANKIRADFPHWKLELESTDFFGDGEED